MFLIVSCTELGDQWECDANREPVCLTENWREWYKMNQPSFRFEVYETQTDNSFKLIKDYEESMEEGMIFGWWDDDEKFHIVKKWKDATRKDKVPNIVIKYLKGSQNTDKSLKNCGYISFEKNNKWYVYGEYSDSHYPHGC